MDNENEGKLVVESEVDSSILETAPVEGEAKNTDSLEQPAEGTETVKTALAEDANLETAADAQSVPKERMDELINENAELKSRMDLMEQNSALRAANAPRVEPAEEFDIHKHVGASEDGEDSISVGQSKKVRQYDNKVYQTQIDDIRFHQQNPDFITMVGTNEQIAQGKFAAPLAAAFKENPALLDQIKSIRDPQEAKRAALAIARSAAGKVAASTGDEDVIEEAVRNAKRVKSVKTVRGGSGVSEEHRYSTMTDDAFIALARKRGANI